MDERYKQIKLYFEENEHKYFDSLGNSYTSCTTLLHNYKNEFKRKYWLRKKAKELNITEKELEKQWAEITEESCNRGNKTHNYLEDTIKEISKFNKAIKYLNTNSGQMITIADIPYLDVQPLDIKSFIESTENKYPEIYTVFEYYINNGYTIFSEIGSFLIDYLISGTIDILCIKKDRFVILDWKTNKDGLKFESGYFKKDKSSKPYQLTNEWIRTKDYLKPPIAHLPDCNGTIYSLQLSMYALMVEIILNIPCAGLGLCHIGSPFVLNDYGMPLTNNKGMYIIDEDKPEIINWYKINNLRKECNLIINDHKLRLGAENINKQYKLEL